MTDDSRRNLRVRKNPKYLNSDEQDPDKVSFSQLKSHHDHNSIQQQKAQDAKTLVKLITKINKNYKTYLTQRSANAMQAQRRQPNIKDRPIANPSEPTKKQPQPTGKSTPKQTSVKPKSGYNFKSQPTTATQQAPRQSQAYLNQLKQMTSMPSISSIGKGLFTDQLKKLQNLYPDMKNISYQSLAQNTNPNLFSSNSYNISTPYTKIQPQVKEKQKPKSMFSEQKLFKRSAYHVAIAYHIYLKNLKQKGGVIGNEIDPTYHAKKLKETRPNQ